MIPRTSHISHLKGLLSRHRVVAILGTRQVGKTTLARQFMGQHPERCTLFDLENPRDQARLSEPMLALEALEGLVILDEIQRRPDIFPILRVLADRSGCPARFLVLGSASPNLLRQSSESLAGRIAFHRLDGFSLEEVGPDSARQLWLKGGFPQSFLASSAQDSAEWRREFVATFLERDLPQLGISLSSKTLRRLWSMLAHYHGQTLNLSELARAFGVADTTVRRYLEVLVSTFMVRVLPPWHANLRKRQVKSPKLYLTDAGLLHTLLSVTTMDDLEGHPKVGASWEGFASQMVIAHLGARPEECYFWATHTGAELDLLIIRGQQRRAFEFKRTDAPRTTRSMQAALEDLELTSLDVVHAGRDTFPLGPKFRAVALTSITNDIDPLS